MLFHRLRSAFRQPPRSTRVANPCLPIALAGSSGAGKDFLFMALVQEIYTATGLLPTMFATEVGPPYCRVSLDSGVSWVVPECFPNFETFRHFLEVPSTTPTGGPEQGGAGKIGIQIGTIGPGAQEVDLHLWNTVGQTPAAVQEAGAYLLVIKATDLDHEGRWTEHGRRLILRESLISWASALRGEVGALSGRNLPWAIVLTCGDEVEPGSRVYATVGGQFMAAWQELVGIDADTPDIGVIYKAAAMVRWANPLLWNLLRHDPVFREPLEMLVGAGAPPPIFLTSAVQGKYLHRANRASRTIPSADELQYGPQPILASAPFIYLLCKMMPERFNFGNW